MKLLRRVFRKVIWAVSGLLILVLVLHTPPARSLLRGILTRLGEKQVSGQIEVGRLNYRLWRGSAELRDVAVELPGLHLRADRIKIVLFSKHGLSVQADRVLATISPQPAPAQEKPSGPGPSYPWSFLGKLGVVRVADGLVEWQGGPSERTVSGSITLERLNDEKGDGARNWSVRSRLNHQRAGRSAVPLEIEGVLGLEGQGLRLTSVHLSSAENSLTVSGVFQQTHPLEGDIRGEVRAATSLTETLGLDLPVQGTIRRPVSFRSP